MQEDLKKQKENIINLEKKDINKAKYWWRKASAQGYTDATISLQQVYD